MTSVAEIHKKEQVSRISPLYENLQALIVDDLKNGKLKPGQQLYPVESLAERWDVSPAAVQRSLQALATNGIVIRKQRQGTFISDEAMNLAGKMAHTTSRSVSLFVPSVGCPEYAYLLRSLQDVCHAKELDVTVFSTDNDVKRYSQMIQRQIDARVFGIVLVPPIDKILPLETIVELYNSEIPVICCFRGIDSTEWPAVEFDPVQSISATAEHLCSIGRKNIGFVGFSEFANQHYTFIKALVRKGISIEEQYQLDLTASNNGMFGRKDRRSTEYEEVVEKWLKQCLGKIDAVCCVSDQLALLVIRLIEKLGYKVPQDVAVTGSGFLSVFYGYSDDYLTTTDPNFELLATEICELLVAVRKGEKLELRKKVVTEGKLIVGKSTVST